MTMTWDKLSPRQKHEVKEHYLIGLADAGKFIETIYGQDKEPERGPSQGELANADKLVSDETMKEIYGTTIFVADDFFSSSPHEPEAFTPRLIFNWCANHLTQKGFAEARDRLHVNCDIVDGIFWSRELIQDFCERFENGQLTEEEVKEMKGEK